MKRKAILGVLAGALLVMLAGGAALAATETGTKGDDLLVGTEMSRGTSAGGVSACA